MISHEQAQTLHQCIGQGIERDGDYLAALDTALELASVIVSDTDPEGEVAGALATVLQAAESWRDELDEHIIPASVAAQDGAEYGTGRDELDKAIELLCGTTLAPWPEPKPEVTTEFNLKREMLAEFLYGMNNSEPWQEADAEYHANYLADADQVLRSHPHLLGLDTREHMGLI